MCKSCFESEIENFASETEWLAFDLILTKKLGKNQIKFLYYNSDGEHSYKCVDCKQVWRLLAPNYSVRGYLKSN